MAMRITGMNSGLDTESIIQELVAAKRTKVDDQKKAKTKHEWKQEAWKELNTKLKNLQSKYIANMRFESSYSKKTSKVSNSSVASVITGGDAVNSVQTLRVKQLAKTGYLTGSKIQSSEGNELTALSKLSDIVGENGFSGEGTFTIKAGNKKVDVTVTADTTISDVLNQVKEAGLNASFDANQQRFFISAKESGADNDFSITAADSNGAKALESLGLQTDITKDKATMAEYAELASYMSGDKVSTLANMDSLIKEEIAGKTNSYLKEYESLTKSIEAAEKKISEINDKYTDLKTVDEYKTELEAKNEAIKAKEEEIAGLTDPDAKKAAEEELKTLKEEADVLKEKQTAAETLKTQQTNLDKYQADLDKVNEYITVTKKADGTNEAVATAKLQTEVEDSLYAKASYAADVVNGTVSLTASATKVSGQNAIIYLNDAEFEDTTNTFKINGLTITAMNETKDGEEVTITTEQDTDGIYDMVKNFLKEYNSIVNEMDKLYNADSAKGYEPLTDEEKDAMSESEIEEWEEKIKGALLRRDDNLSTVNNALQTIMASGIQVNGKTMYLHDFGINNLGYFNSADNEKHAYHIDGDPDNANTSGKEDVLKSMIAAEPDTVISFFSQLSKNLHEKMNDLSKSVEGYRTYGNFYDDKKMKSDYDGYTSKIADLEEKLTDYEDKWYAKFSAMETALAKMQSNANAVTSLLGG